MSPLPAILDICRAIPHIADIDAIESMTVRGELAREGREGLLRLGGRDDQQDPSPGRRRILGVASRRERRAVSCRRGGGQKPMVDVFRTDPHRLGTIIILGDSMLLILTSDGAQLQLQGHGLGKHLLWHCSPSLEDLWKMQGPPRAPLGN